MQLSLDIMVTGYAHIVDSCVVNIPEPHTVTISYVFSCLQGSEAHCNDWAKTQLWKLLWKKQVLGISKGKFKHLLSYNMNKTNILSLFVGQVTTVMLIWIHNSVCSMPSLSSWWPLPSSGGWHSQSWWPLHLPEEEDSTWSFQDKCAGAVSQSSLVMWYLSIVTQQTEFNVVSRMLDTCKSTKY